ncbi:MAG: DUF4255 domain-containing protein [Chloroflexaceae bacterium]|jgi:hypothetical protein|nr:DUF4255 domain-containing protein [Chloroflexaceae bacterium]
MGGYVAVAVVAAALKQLLENGLVSHNVAGAIGSDIVVSALPPDRIVTGSDERPQVNLFLYQIAPHVGLHRHERPLASPAGSRLPAPMAFDLHFLVTAYGASDGQIETLLSYALLVLHQSPVLHVAQREGLAPINLSPVFLSTEELARLWSAFQARYRPSVAYRVSPVLLEPAL